MGMNVLSLFDGMSVGQLALKKAGIEVDKYYASEIDKYAIKIAKKNFPKTIHIGSVTDVDVNKLEPIDLLIGGSSCQDFSIVGNKNGMITKNKIEIVNLKQYLKLKEEGFEFEGESYLFWEYVRILKDTKPKYFLLENVVMKDKWKNIISDALGIKPIKINSNLVSAQDRPRLYWTNIKGITQPENKGIVLEDIIISANKVDDKYWYNDVDFVYNGDDKKIIATIDLKGYDIIKRVYNPNNKCGTLTCCKGGNRQKKIYQNGKCRKLTPLEYERLQTVPDNYTNGVADTHRYNMLGNGWTVDVIAHIFSFINKPYKQTIDDFLGF